MIAEDVNVLLSVFKTLSIEDFINDTEGVERVVEIDTKVVPKCIS